MVHQSSLIFWVCVLRTELGLAEWTGLEPATLGVTGRYSNQLNYHSAQSVSTQLRLAEWTGLEPATLGVTGRYSNQLNYHSIPSSVVTEKQNYTELLSPVKVSI